MPLKPVDTAIKVIVGPLIDDTDFKTREEAVAYNAAGMEIDLIVEKADGTIATTAVTPTTGGDYDWAHADQGYYELELPASGGASFNNTEEGTLTAVGHATGVLPFRSPSYDIVPTKVYNSLVKGTDNLETDTVLLDGDTQSVDDLKDFADTGYDPSTHRVKANLEAILGHLLTQTGTQVADGFQNFFDQASAAFSVATALADFKATGFAVASDVTTAHSTTDGLIGTPIALDGGAATLGAMLTKMADDNGGATFDAGTDSLSELTTAVVAGIPSSEHADAEPGGGSVVTGTNTANDSDSTWLDNGTYWQVAAAAAVGGFGLNVTQVFTLGTDLKANIIRVNAKENLGGVVHVWAYNYLTTSWDQLSDTDTAIKGTSDDDYSYTVFPEHQQASDGETQIRFTSTATTTNKYLYLDQVLISVVAINELTAAEIATAVWVNEYGHDVAHHMPKYTGQIWYVDGDDGDDTNIGDYVHGAFATIGAAITAASAGDRITVKAGTYDEAGFELPTGKDALELRCEPGTTLTDSGSSTQTLLVTGNKCVVSGLTVTEAGQIGVKVTGSSVTLEDIIAGPACTTAFDIDGVGCLMRRNFAALPTVAGFDFGGGQIKAYECETIGNAATTGFLVSAGDLGIIKWCNSNGHTTAGWQVDAGVDDLMIISCSSGPDDGAMVDNGTNISWRDFKDDTNSATINAACDTALSDWGKTGFSLASTGMDTVVLPADIVTASSIKTGAFTADAFAANALVAATFAASSLDDKGNWNTVVPNTVVPNTVVPDAAGVVATALGTLETHGDSAWATATGFATAGDSMTLTSGERTTLAGVIWNTLTSGFTTAGSIGKWIIDKLDATITSRHASGAAVAKSPATLDWSADVSNKPTIGTSTLDASGVRAAVGLASANLDTQLSGLLGYVDCLPATLNGSTLTALPDVTTDAASRTASKADVSVILAVANKLDTTMVLDGAVYDFTTAALAAAPSGSGGDATEAKQNEIIVDLADMKGSGFVKDTHSLPQCLTTTISSATTTFTPVSVTVSAGAITDNTITQYQHAAFGPFVFTIVDDDDAAIDLSSSDLTFCVYNADDSTTVLWSVNSDDGDISVGGASSNQVTVSGDDTNTATSGIFRYVLWDTTNDYVRARGVLTISNEADNG